MKEIYKKREIQFDTHKEEWFFIEKRGIAEGGNERMSNVSLKELKKYIDKMDKKGFERVPVYIIADWYRSDKSIVYVAAEVTSISPDGKDIWTISSAKERQKNPGTLYERSEANHERIEKINKLTKQKIALETEIDELEDSLVELDGVKMINEFLKK